MKTKIRKYAYLFVIQGYYGVHGWEDLSESENRKEALEDLRAYRANESQYPHRMIQRRAVTLEYVAAIAKATGSPLGDTQP